MAHADFDQKLEALLDVRFNYLQVEREITAWTSFSDTKIKLKADFDGFERFFRLRHLVDEKKLTAAITSDWKKIETVVASSLALKYDPEQQESRVVEELSELILLPLCNCVAMEDGKHDPKTLKVGLKVSALGIGSKHTWHGSPDCRMFPQELNILSREEDVEDEEEVEDEEKEASQKAEAIQEVEASMEAEALNGENVRSQVVATTVVVAFTHNYHNKEITMAPVLLMCKRRVRVCIYDCSADILGYSEEVTYPTGVYLIWAIYNRYVWG